MSSFNPIENILNYKLKNSPELKARMVLDIFKNVVKLICGEMVSQRIKPISFFQGTIKVQCADSSTATEINLYKEDIIKILNEKKEVFPKVISLKFVINNNQTI